MVEHEAHPSSQRQRARWRVGWLALFVLAAVMVACNSSSDSPTPTVLVPQASQTTSMGESESEVELAVVATPLPDGTLSGNPLADVPSHPSQSDPTNARPFFDTFSWQNFIALNWPADPNAGEPGVPLTPNDPSVFGKYDQASGQLPVWFTWKTATDLFPGPGEQPIAWNKPSTPVTCRDIPNQGDRLVLNMVSKVGTVLDNDLNEAFAGPLFDQAGALTMYSINVNKVEYNFISDKGYYDKANWPVAPTPIVLPSGTANQVGIMEAKSAWRNMAGVPEEYRDRFFTLDVLTVELGTCETDGTGNTSCLCEEETVGLVGLHIAQKTPGSPQWIWSTFEQVDNLGEDTLHPASGMTPSYVNPQVTPNPTQVAQGYSYEPAPIVTPTPSGELVIPPPTPVNVWRITDIATTPAGNSTTELNDRYRALVAGTVWENYQLIATQWPSDPSAPGGSNYCSQQNTGSSISPGSPFPPCTVANSTMESYLQYDSCMNCHSTASTAGVSADFSQMLNLRAVPVPVTPTP